MADQPDWTTGVQNVAAATLIYNAAPAVAAGVPFEIPVDVSQWGSLYVNIVNGGNACPITWSWKDSTGTLIIPGGTINVVSAGDNVKLQIPVITARLFLTFSFTAGATPVITIVGSTQVITKPNYGDYASQAFSFTPAWVAGTLQVIGELKSSGGECYLYARSIGAANKGFIGYQVALTNVAFDTELVTDTGEWHTDASGSLAVGKYVTLPPGNCNIIWLPETSGVYTVTALFNPTKA